MPDFVERQNARRPRRLRVPADELSTAAVSCDGVFRKHRSSIFYEDWLRLSAETANVLVAHEAPDCHPNGFAAITSLAQSLGVRSAFHGHHHDSLDFRKHDERLGFAAYGVGFMGITDMFGGLIRVGCFDE